MNSYILVQFVWKLVGKKKLMIPYWPNFCYTQPRFSVPSTNFVVSAALHQIASFPTLSSTTVIFPR